MQYSDIDKKDILLQLKATESGAFFREERFQGVIRVDGKDTLELLNRLSTARVDNLKPGGVRETLLVNEKGRFIDAILVVPVDATTVRLVTSSPDVAAVLAWLEKYTIMEDCVYSDESEDYAQYTVYNRDVTDSDNALPVHDPGTVHGVWEEDDEILLRYESVTGTDLRVLCSNEHADQTKEKLLNTHGLTYIGEEAFELWRIDRLLPAAGRELGAWSNPLEAGASAGIDFAKGCFIGQEVIARLENYEKVQRAPVQLLWDEGAPPEVEPGSRVQFEEQDAGLVTTHIFDPRIGKFRGIGLIRNAYQEAGTTLRYTIGNSTYSLRTEHRL